MNNYRCYGRNSFDHNFKPFGSGSVFFLVCIAQSEIPCTTPNGRHAATIKGPGEGQAWTQIDWAEVFSTLPTAPTVSRPLIACMWGRAPCNQLAFVTLGFLARRAAFCCMSGDVLRHFDVHSFNTKRTPFRANSATDASC